jgi:hypothetical protein
VGANVTVVDTVSVLEWNCWRDGHMWTATFHPTTSGGTTMWRCCKCGLTKVEYETVQPKDFD